VISKFQKAVEDIRFKKCAKCDGIGEIDDADFGDIFFNTWECPDCNGTGFAKQSNANLTDLTLVSPVL
jgi:DnaJ-class molecular chaperone